MPHNTIQDKNSDNTKALQAFSQQLISQHYDNAAAYNNEAVKLITLYQHNHKRYANYKKNQATLIERLNYLLTSDKASFNPIIILSLLLLLADNAQKIAQLPFPVINLYKKYLSTSTADIHKPRCITTDQILKDFSIFAGYSYLTELEIASVSSSHPVKLYLKKGILGCIKYMLHTAQSGDYQPHYYELHMNDRNLKNFNYQSKLRCYQQLAQQLEMDHRVCGVYGSSWWYDPQLSNISPSLAHFYEEAKRTDALIIEIPYNQNHLKHALKCPHRAALYKAGKYVPHPHVVIWPRKKFIRHFS